MTATLVAPRIAIKNILFPTDFTAASADALPYAISIAQEYGARVHIVHVLLPAKWQSPGLQPVGSFEIGFQTARDRIAEFIADSHFNGVEYDSAVPSGIDVASTLSSLVETNDIDLLIAGTSGREGVKRLFEGSVAEEVFRTVSCPVLVVGPRAGRRVPRKLQKLLFATDLTKDSLAALPFVVGFADDHHAHLIVAHVPPRDRSDQNVTNATRKLMDQLVPEHANVEREVLLGWPPDAILKLAEDRECDLIMVGAHHANLLSTHLPGGFDHRIVDEAYCPVLIVRAHNGE
jgi:nucleotide-binding universal stress UspA family protein